ncbi:hypothetical protein A9B99_09485 [Mangrovibacter phragmitis]|uniref:Uncharacterized protein n=1 Tax=Mangrovibacter phragmitis TaxID=1691903 RepID=A0A1B7L2K9_9ENTR|nr:hypothetical protein A9B99_09485 [Mangrovibacter phragmitis]
MYLAVSIICPPCRGDIPFLIGLVENGDGEMCQVRYGIRMVPVGCGFAGSMNNAVPPCQYPEPDWLPELDMTSTITQ